MATRFLASKPIAESFVLEYRDVGETFIITAARKPDGSAWAGPVIADDGAGVYTARGSQAGTETMIGFYSAMMTGMTTGEAFTLTWEVIDALDPSLLRSAPITSAMALINGDDYLTIDGRALIFSLDNVADLTAATVTLTIAYRAQTITAPGIVTNPGASTQTVTVELTAAQTATLPVGAQSCRYDLAAVLANGHKVTLARGMVAVTADVP